MSNGFEHLTKWHADPRYVAEWERAVSNTRGCMGTHYVGLSDHCVLAANAEMERLRNALLHVAKLYFEVAVLLPPRPILVGLSERENKPSTQAQ